MLGNSKEAELTNIWNHEGCLGVSKISNVLYIMTEMKDSSGKGWESRLWGRKNNNCTCLEIGSK